MKTQTHAAQNPTYINKTPAQVGYTLVRVTWDPRGKRVSKYAPRRVVECLAARLPDGKIVCPVTVDDECDPIGMVRTAAARLILGHTYNAVEQSCYRDAVAA